MRILFAGGTRFVGRAMVTSAVARGHDVTVLHRGQTGGQGDPALDQVEHLLADRDVDLSVLAGREFDATVDVCAYVPRQVRSLAEALDGRGGHHVFISTVSTYAEPPAPAYDEDSALLRLDDPTTEEVTGATYGGLKVLCEQAATEAYGSEGLAIIRPTYVVGPHDHTGRFTWWVRRIGTGGEVLVPGPHDAPMQVIDARDQGDFTVRLCEERTSGPFTSASPAPPFGFGDLLDATVAAVGPAGTRLTWVDPAWYAERDGTYLTAPLWTEGTGENVLAAATDRAVAAGLTVRPLEETIRDTWTWLQQADPAPVPGWGSAPEREAELLAEWS
ncbi:MAG: NAD-dependent epimerase/dehydratase family protein [Nocardioidaceae bacterium]